MKADVLCHGWMVITSMGYVLCIAGEGDSPYRTDGSISSENGGADKAGSGSVGSGGGVGEMISLA